VIAQKPSMGDMFFAPGKAMEFAFILTMRSNVMSIKFVHSNAKRFHGGLKIYEVSVLGIK
jgi:hypothetical protein